MDNKGLLVGLLVVLAFIFILVTINPAIIGTTAASITPTKWFGNWWLNLGNAPQTFIIVVIFIVIIALVVSREK